MKKQHLITGAAALVVVLGGGALYLGHAASSVAKDRVDGFLIRKDLNSKVSYGGISASMFGSVAIDTVTVTIGPQAKVRLGTVKVDHLDVHGDQLYGAKVTATGVDLVVPDLVRSGMPELAGLAALGYKHLKGEVTFAFSYDDGKNSLVVETDGDFDGAGSWKSKFKLEGVQPSLIETVSDFAQKGGANPLAALGLMFQGAAAFTTVQIADVDVTVDDRGIHQREAEFPDTALPPDTGAAPAKAAIGERDLIKAGLNPSEAQDTAKTISAFVANGGTLHIRSDLDQPRPLFKPGNGFMPVVPAINSAAEFLALTKAKVSS